MSTQLLAVLVAFVAFSQIGCSDDKPKSRAEVQSQINACIFDPTGQCQQRAKVISENPQMAGQINQAGQSAVANGGTGAVQVVTAPDGTKQVIPLLPKSITQQDIQTEAQRVQTALNQGQPVVNGTSADRAPASTPVASNAGSSGSPILPASAPVVGGGGEIVR